MVDRVGRQSDTEGRLDDVHSLVESRLRRGRRRYTATSRAVVDALDRSSVALTIADLIEACGSATSSTYRSVQQLCAVSIAREVPHIGQARFELDPGDDPVVGLHVQCRSCGVSTAAENSPDAMEAVRVLSASIGASNGLGRVDSITVVGVCTRCGPCDECDS